MATGKKKSRRGGSRARTPPDARTWVARAAAWATTTWRGLGNVARTVLVGSTTAVLATGLTALLSDIPVLYRRNAGGSPLTVAVDKWEDRCTSNWFLPGPPDEIDFSGQPATTLPPGHPDTYEWPAVAVSEGGAAASPAEVIATVQGRTETEVVLTGIQVHVIERRPVPSGTVLDEPCGDVGAFRWLSVDLDQDPPVVTADYDESAAEMVEAAIEQREPVRFPYVVSSSEAESFLIKAETVDCDCDWTASLSWQSEGRSGVVMIDDDGEPFRTVSTRAATAVCTQAGDCGDPP